MKTNPNWDLMTRQHYHKFNLQNKMDINIPRFRLTFDCNSTLAYKLFNKLPDSVRNLRTPCFKNKLTQWLGSKCFYSVEEFLLGSAEGII